LLETVVFVITGEEAGPDEIENEVFVRKDTYRNFDGSKGTRETIIRSIKDVDCAFEKTTKLSNYTGMGDAVRSQRYFFSRLNGRRNIVGDKILALHGAKALCEESYCSDEIRLTDVNQEAVSRRRDAVMYLLARHCPTSPNLS
jgi:hypothetical protein